MDLGGGRTGKIVFKADDFAIPGLIEGLTTEVHYGERIGVVGPNGAGKSHLLRLLGGEDIPHSGVWKLGARVDPGLFSQTNDRSDLESIPLVEIMRGEGLDLTRAMSGSSATNFIRRRRTVSSHCRVGSRRASSC